MPTTLLRCEETVVVEYGQVGLRLGFFFFFPFFSLVPGRIFAKRNVYHRRHVKHEDFRTSFGLRRRTSGGKM